MDREPTGIAFAVIGHQDSWETVMQFVGNIRTANNNLSLPVEKVKQVYTFIPPRKLFDIEVHSIKNCSIKGAYIETFIAPDELDTKHLRKNIEKVKEACVIASKLSASIVSLGGFSSIVLESGNVSFTSMNGTSFTTGNTLTAAFITRGVEKACLQWNVELASSNVLIIGSTGDIGSACVQHFAERVKNLLLCARQQGPLQKQSEALSRRSISHVASTSLTELVPQADIIISVASSIIESNDLDHLRQETIVCDAGYPKNLQNDRIQEHERLFYGGMGTIKSGFTFENDAHKSLYKFCLPNVSHGCLLESVVLAMENKYCAFSKGKGNITTYAMENILSMAKKHGIETAPLFNRYIITASGVKEKVNG